VTFLWIIVGTIAIVVAAITLVDIFRHHLGAAATVGWSALVILLPLVGSVIYWARRRYTPAEAEEAYLAEADVRRGASNRYFDV
jgi:hypothetical protein